MLSTTTTSSDRPSPQHLCGQHQPYLLKENYNLRGRCQISSPRLGESRGDRCDMQVQNPLSIRLSRISLNVASASRSVYNHVNHMEFR